jgi:signal transduction histidine kinase
MRHLFASEFEAVADMHSDSASPAPTSAVAAPAIPRAGRYGVVAWLVVCAVLLTAGIVLATASLIASSRERVLADNDRELKNTAFILSEQTGRDFQALELIQRSTIDRMQTAGIRTGDDLRRIMSTYDMHIMLKDKISGLPQVETVAIFDAPGTMVNLSRQWPVPRVSITEREYFKALIADRQLTSFLGEPVINQTTGTWSIYLARKFTAADGALLGFVIVGMRLDHFQELFASIALGEGAAISLFRRDGTLLARHPQIDRTVGAKVNGARLIERSVVRQDPRPLRITSSVDGQERVVALRALTHYPVVIAVSTTMSAVLDQWRSEAKFIAATGGLAALIVAVVVLMILRQLRQGQKQTQQVLDAQSFQLNAALDNMHHALLMFDKSGRAIVINGRYRAMYGLSPEKAKPGCTLRELLEQRVAAGTLAGDIDQYVADLHANGEVSARATDLPDGRTILVTHRFMASGGWVSTHEDISARRQAEAERSAIEQRLQQAQKFEAVGNLSGGLAHDFNNLLTIIIGNLDLLQADVAGNPAAEQKRATIMEASLHGADLTRQMLAFSRRQSLNPQPVEINGLVEKTIRLLRRTLGEEIAIDFSAAADLGMAIVDQAQLEAAVVNVAINARDAMPGGGKLTIATNEAVIGAGDVADRPEVAAGDYITITMCDTGTGISPEALPRIFDPFFTTKDPGKGTGLGLAMVYGFIKQSGGHVTVASEVGSGTTLTLFLPRAAGMAPEAGMPERAAAEPATPAGGEVILAVDDNAAVRASAVRQLADLGYQVLEADDGLGALDVLDRTDRIDLLFTDVVMPGGLNGKQLAGMARMKRPDLKVLFTSGFPRTSSDGGPAQDLGGMLLSKPYRKHELASAIRSALAS